MGVVEDVGFTVNVAIFCTRSLTFSNTFFFSTESQDGGDLQTPLGKFSGVLPVATNLAQNGAALLQEHGTHSRQSLWNVAYDASIFHYSYCKGIITVPCLANFIR